MGANLAETKSNLSVVFSQCSPEELIHVPQQLAPSRKSDVHCLCNNRVYFCASAFPWEPDGGRPSGLFCTLPDLSLLALSDPCEARPGDGGLGKGLVLWGWHWATTNPAWWGSVAAVATAPRLSGSGRVWGTEHSCWMMCACGQTQGAGQGGPWHSADGESEVFHCVFSLVGMDGFLKSDERQRLAKERREEREKCLGKLCTLAV